MNSENALYIIKTVLESLAVLLLFAGSIILFLTCLVLGVSGVLLHYDFVLIVGGIIGMGASIILTMISIWLFNSYL